jgi:transposase InsO family protein
LSPRGRLLLARCVVDHRSTLRRAAERFQTSATTAARWAGRYREQGRAGMVDRLCRPHRSPGRTPIRLERRINMVRVTRRWGSARIGYLLGVHPSTAHRVLARYGMARLAWLDRPTGRVVRRYEHPAPGDLVHLDVKKLGGIPDGGGWRIHGRAARPLEARTRLRLPAHRSDDHSRMAYSEVLADEGKETAAAFWTRATVFFTGCGITVRRVLTDNGACYRSFDFRDALDGVVHKRTRPYRPATNGKVERFHRTLLEEACRQPRCAPP